MAAIGLACGPVRPRLRMLGFHLPLVPLIPRLGMIKMLLHWVLPPHANQHVSSPRRQMAGVLGGEALLRQTATHVPQRFLRAPSLTEFRAIPASGSELRQWRLLWDNL